SKHDVNIRGQRENRPAVGTNEAVQPVEKVEQKLADDFEHSEFHDLGFVVIEPGQAMVNFRSGPKLELRTVGLAGRQLKSGHPQGAGKSVSFLFQRDIETPAPNAIALRR